MDGVADKKEALEVDGNLENEDFFYRLTEEEKECLQYLLETIDSLDAENEEDDENANTNQDPSNSIDVQKDGNFDVKQRNLSASAKGLDKTDHDPSLSKMKIIKSFSEDCPGCSITVIPDVGYRSASSHPSHLRKFDTIMRSGVNVQELRARFIHQQDQTAYEDHSKGPEISGASKHPTPISRNQKSPRQEALQKLGLLKRKQSNPNTNGSPEIHHGVGQSSTVQNCEIKQNHSKGGSNSTGSLERKSGKTGNFEKLWPP